MIEIPTMSQLVMILLTLCGTGLLGLILWNASRSFGKLEEIARLLPAIVEQIKTLFSHIERHEREIENLRRSKSKR